MARDRSISRRPSLLCKCWSVWLIRKRGSACVHLMLAMWWGSPAAPIVSTLCSGNLRNSLKYLFIYLFFEGGGVLKYKRGRVCIVWRHGGGGFAPPLIGYGISSWTFVSQTSGLTIMKCFASDMLCSFNPSKTITATNSGYSRWSIILQMQFWQIDHCVGCSITWRDLWYAPKGCDCGLLWRTSLD